MSSKIPIWLVMKYAEICRSKPRLANALTALQKYIELYSDGSLSPRMASYLCPVCKKWHLGVQQRSTLPGTLRRLAKEANRDIIGRLIKELI